MDILRWLENAIFEVGFCKYSISKKSNVVQRIYKRGASHSLVSRVYKGPTMVGPGEKFLNSRFLEGWKTLF